MNEPYTKSFTSLRFLQGSIPLSDSSSEDRPCRSHDDPRASTWRPCRAVRLRRRPHAAARYPASDPPVLLDSTHSCGDGPSELATTPQRTYGSVTRPSPAADGEASRRLVRPLWTGAAPAPHPALPMCTATSQCPSTGAAGPPSPGNELPAATASALTPPHLALPRHKPYVSHAAARFAAEAAASGSEERQSRLQPDRAQRRSVAPLSSRSSLAIPGRWQGPAVARGLACSEDSWGAPGSLHAVDLEMVQRGAGDACPDPGRGPACAAAPRQPTQEPAHARAPGGYLSGALEGPVAWDALDAGLLTLEMEAEGLGAAAGLAAAPAAAAGLALAPESAELAAGDSLSWGSGIVDLIPVGPGQAEWVAAGVDDAADAGAVRCPIRVSSFGSAARMDVSVHGPFVALDPAAAAVVQAASLLGWELASSHADSSQPEAEPARVQAPATCNPAAAAPQEEWAECVDLQAWCKEPLRSDNGTMVIAFLDPDGHESNPCWSQHSDSGTPGAVSLHVDCSSGLAAAQQRSPGGDESSGAAGRGRHPLAGCFGSLENLLAAAEGWLDPGEQASRSRVVG